MTSPEEIAGKLTKAQREALERLCGGFAWADRRSVKALERRGLAVSRQCHVWSDTDLDWLSSPTASGRAYLQGNPNDN